MPSRPGLPQKKGALTRPGQTRSALVRQKGLPGGNLKSVEGQLKKAKGAGKGGAAKELGQAKKAGGLKKAAASKGAASRTAVPKRSALVRQKSLPGGNLKSVEGQLKKAKGAGKGGAGKELGQAKKAGGLKKAPALKGTAQLKKAPALKKTPPLKGAASKAMAPKRSALLRQKKVTGQEHLPHRGKAGKITIGKEMSGSNNALSQSKAVQPTKKVGAVEKKVQKPNKPRGMGGILRGRSHIPR